MHKPEDLNDAQWQAVCHVGGHLLIVAGPGTGKTHTLVRRIAQCVPALKADEQILAITFTNKAAAQMQERLGVLGVASDKVFTGTFHAFCLKLLRDHWEQTALPKEFKIASEDDAQAIGFTKAALERIRVIKSTQLVISSDEEYKNYQRALRQKGLIDFDDILREALALLEDEEVAAQVRRRYCRICVDEYQDINVVQNALLKVLAGPSGLITAIGDPHQSIYGFRGSEVKLFHRFAQDFPGAQTLQLTENYRSSANLLTASSQVIAAANARERSAEQFELIAKMRSQGKLVIHEAATDRAEADYIAGQIEKLVGGMDMLSARGAGATFGDIAILYRLNAQRHVIAQALEHLGIPYKVSAKPLRKSGYSDQDVLGQYEEVLDYSVEKVSLLTIHAAKGLEFPVVFMAGCEDKLLPLNVQEMQSDPQEERRLFYVGMTRAKHCLYLTHAGRRQLFGKTVFHGPSPFLADIEEELKAYEAARKKARKPVPVDDGQIKLF